MKADNETVDLAAREYDPDYDLAYTAADSAQALDVGGQVYNFYPGVNFRMKHAYTRLGVTLTRGDDYGNTGAVTAVSLTLNGGGKLYSTGTQNIATAVYTAGTADLAKLAYTVPADTKLTAAAKTASFSYLLPPGKSGTISDLTLSVTVDGITTRTTVSAAELALKAGTYYSVKATLNYNGLTTATLKTTDWDSQPAWNEEVTFVPDFPYVDIGLDFLIAPGNLIATPDGAGGYTYAFAQWQGYYSGDPTKGDYFARNMLEPNKENPDDANNWNWTAAHDPCRQVDDGTWYTPTYDQWQTIGATENVWGTYTKGGKTVNGYYFGTKSLSAAQAHPNNYVFLPAAGLRWYHTTFDKANAEGIYLHGEQGDCVVYFAGWGVSLSDMNTGYIGSVRCVKDKPKPKPEHAIEVEGLDFYVADGNLIGTADGNGGYTYAFGEDQGYYAGNVDYSSTPVICKF